MPPTDKNNQKISVNLFWKSTYILQPIGILSLLRTSHILDIIPIVLVYSTSYGGITVIKAVVTGDFYGRQNYGSIYGIIQGISTWGGIWTLDSRSGYDVKGSYYWAFTSFALMMGLTALFVLLLKRPVLEKGDAHYGAAQA